MHIFGQITKFLKTRLTYIANTIALGITEWRYPLCPIYCMPLNGVFVLYISTDTFRSTAHIWTLTQKTTFMTDIDKRFSGWHCGNHTERQDWGCIERGGTPDVTQQLHFYISKRGQTAITFTLARAICPNLSLSEISDLLFWKNCYFSLPSSRQIVGGNTSQLTFKTLGLSNFLALTNPVIAEKQKHDSTEISFTGYFEYSL